MVIGIGTGQNVETAIQRRENFGAHMQTCMKVDKVTRRVASDYSAIIEAQANGDIQLHWAGPAAYAIGWDISGGNMEPIAMDVSKGGELGYTWVVMVKADTPYQTMEDLKGKSLWLAHAGFGFGVCAADAVFPRQRHGQGQHRAGARWFAGPDRQP